MLTLQIKRVGTTLTKSYKLDGQSDFSLISSFTDNSVAGWAIFDLTNYADQASAVKFTSFNIEPLAAVPEPATWAMLLGGLALVGVQARRRARRQ